MISGANLPDRVESSLTQSMPSSILKTGMKAFYNAIITDGLVRAGNLVLVLWISKDFEPTRSTISSVGPLILHSTRRTVWHIAQLPCKVPLIVAPVCCWLHPTKNVQVTSQLQQIQQSS